MALVHPFYEFFNAVSDPAKTYLELEVGLPNIIVIGYAISAVLNQAQEVNGIWFYNAHEIKYPGNLVKPSFFTLPASPVLVTTPISVALTPAIYPYVNPQYLYGTPLVQTLPLLTSPSFVTSTQIPPNSGTLNREKIQDVLLMLVQDN
ncbi:hypothetical protein FXO38_12305 [Capsicum annuum]|nr:hypothetical protein FXO38_12305 [Capsicum annuum]